MKKLKISLLSKFLKRKLENGGVKSAHVEYVKLNSTCRAYLKELYTSH